VPASQSEQYEEPSTEEPLVHGSHAVMPDSAAKKPASHGMQPFTETIPVADELVPGGHALHLASASTPVALE
jgi:hypothetical protein